jgi:hypothetical protein
MTAVALARAPSDLFAGIRATIAARLMLAATALMMGAFRIVLSFGTAAAPVQRLPLGRRARHALTGIILALTAFTNAGAAIVTNRISQAGTAAKNIGWGIGTANAAVGDTTLGTESAPTTSGGRTVGTESRTTGSVTNDQYTVTGTVTAGSTLAITEAGLFDAVTSGNMLIRGNFSAVNVVSGDSIAFTFNLRFVPSAA